MELERQADQLVEAGRTERNAGNTQRGRELYFEAAEKYRAHGNLLKFAHTIRHVADMDRNMGRFDLAEPAYREALAIYRANPDTVPLDLANALNGFAKLLAAKGEWEETTRFTNEAMEIYLSLDIEPGVSECKRRLASL